MKKILLILLLSLVSFNCYAEYVSGYKRRDGTYVSGYWRKPKHNYLYFSEDAFQTGVRNENIKRMDENIKKIHKEIELTKKEIDVIKERQRKILEEFCIKYNCK